MSTLMGLLDMGAGAIIAQNAGIATASNNAANVNTEGYSRQRVDLRANVGSPILGGGSFGDPQRIGSDLLAGRQRLIGSSVGYFDTLSSSLLDLEGVITAAEGDIPAGFGEFFGNLNNVATSPLDPQQREAVMASARRLSASFRQQSDDLQRSRKDADERIRDTVLSASSLSAEIAKLNKAIQLQGDPVLLDQRETAALKLSELIGGKARIDGDGQMRFMLDNGSVVVDGTRAASLEATSDASLGGMSRIEVVDGAHRSNITQSVTSGKLGADIYFRDTVTVRIVAEVDQLAFDFATNVNAIHRGYAGLDGVGGRDLFVEPVGVVGAAALFELDPTIDADPSLLATAGLGQPSGDNNGMLDLLAMQDQLLAGGGTRTFVDESIRYISGVGQDVRAAVVDQKFNEAQKFGLDTLRDSISGVSLEEELNRLSQFQNASQANMRFVQSIDQLLGRMIDLL